MLRSAAEVAAEVIEVKETLTPEFEDIEDDIVEDVTLRSDLRPFRPSRLLEVKELLEVETELIGVLLEAVEVTKGTEVTDTELVGASLPFSLTLAGKKILRSIILP